MLKFRRNRTQATSEAPAKAAEAMDNTDRARALLALLGEDAQAAGLTDGNLPPSAMSSEGLRAMARDLIAEVEAQTAKNKASGKDQNGASAKKAPTSAGSGGRDPGPQDQAQQAHSARPHRRLFSRAAPLGHATEFDQALADLRDSDRGATTPSAGSSIQVADTAPVPSEPTMPSVPQAISQRRARITPDIPVPLETPVAEAVTPMQGDGALLPIAEVRRLIRIGVDPAQPGGEHPGVIAMMLEGKPPLEQAAALRQLPRGKVRGVHRALRILEMRNREEPAQAVNLPLVSA